MGLQWVLSNATLWLVASKVNFDVNQMRVSQYVHSFDVIMCIACSTILVCS